MTRTRRPSAATLEILNNLAAEPDGLHGYALMQAAGLASGTLYPILYPILKRLSDRGWLEKNWESGADREWPPRRIYKVTELGRTQLQTYLSSDLRRSSKVQETLA